MMWFGATQTTKRKLKETTLYCQDGTNALTLATMPVTAGTNPSPLAIAITVRVIETMPRASRCNLFNHEWTRMSEVTRNPQQFLELALSCIQKSLHTLMVDGIEYERIADAEWEMHRLESEELESYVSRLLEVKNSIYDVVEFESKVEETFARQLDSRNDIKLFFKLPDWFKVETPLGTYNPDWAIVKENDAGQNKVYLVRETKGTTQWMKLPEMQRNKIKCGTAHFKAIGFKEGDYAWVASASDV